MFGFSAPRAGLFLGAFSIISFSKEGLMSAAVSARKRLANRRNARKSTGPRSAEGKARASVNAITHGIFARELVFFGEDERVFDEFRIALLRRLNPRDTLELQIAERIISANWKLKRIHAAEKRLYERFAVGEQVQAEKNRQKEIDELRSEVLIADENRRRARASRDEREAKYEKLVAQQEHAKAHLKDLVPHSPDVLLAKMLEFDTPELERLHRYEQRLDNIINRAMRQLGDLQKQELPVPSSLTQELVGESDNAETANMQNEPTVEQTVASDDGERDSSTDEFIPEDEINPQTAHGLDVGPQDDHNAVLTL
jgi:hypothetical protein